MAAITKYPEPLIFGLDIGTRSIVGTVGYKEQKGSQSGNGKGVGEK